ncbi:MarR family transcriptional regulator [Candidatus Parcubacteria bacterium]|nr:MarR family transcriptional regulator [Candidatus Parcubacteria bacterium]
MVEDSDDIGTLLHLASAGLDKHSDEVLRERLGIGLSQFRVLLSLLYEDGQNQSSIAYNLSQTEASISRQIRLLMGKKLVEARPNPHSRRDKLIFITGKGMMLGQSALSILNNYHSPLFQDITAHDQAALKHILRTVYRHIEQLYEY